MKKYFISWQNIKWIIKELIATCSNKPSYFSKKRIQEWLLFDAAFCCGIYWFCTHVQKLTYVEVIAFMGIIFGYAGYTVATIQKEKRNENKQIDKQEVK